AAAAASAAPTRKSSAAPAKSSQKSDYNRLLGRVGPNWMKAKYRMRRVDDPDQSVIDFNILHEICSREGEGHKKWDKQDQQAGTDDYKIDWIVACADRLPGEDVPNDLLMKHEFYPVPSWQTRAELKKFVTKLIEPFHNRLFGEDFVELWLRNELGDTVYYRVYAHRYLSYERGAGTGGYVTNKRSRYLNRLRAIEYQWNVICDRYGLPRIWICDWTGEEEDDEALMTLEFIPHPILSKAVAAQLRSMNQLGEIKCTTQHCGACDAKKPLHGCCEAGADAIGLDPATREYRWRKQGDTLLGMSLLVECTDECACAPKRCNNRATQWGRQHVLMLFRQPEVGWTVRAVSRIERDTFIVEYVGEVKLADSDQRSHYSYQLNEVPSRPSLVIDAEQKGNLGRFVSHSCVPNATAFRVLVERYGAFFHRVSFFANRTIMPGESISIDYFPEGMTDPEQILEMFPKGCRCGEAECRFTLSQIKDAEEKKRRESGDTVARPRTLAVRLRSANKMPQKTFGSKTLPRRGLEKQNGFYDERREEEEDEGEEEDERE
ncbi:hypothetical protein PFISCL1PPCAC_18331, partial [Pristionchus fissidentatus]